MMKYASAEERLCFSPLVRELKEATFARLKPNRVREDTFTGPEPDGRTPFLDAFERAPGAPYAVCLARGIVASWLDSPRVIHPTDLLAGAPRPQRLLCEHFSWGIQYRPELLSHPAYAPRRAALEARVAAQAARLFPLGEAHIRDEGARIFGSHAAFDALNDALWRVGTYQGHTVPDYPALLAEGVGGALRRVRSHRSAHPEADALYQALEILLEGFSQWILCHAERAAELARADAARAGHYRRIAAACRAVALEPPQTLLQATQLFWFYALWDWVDCAGRLDQTLSPFYRDDPERDDGWQKEEIVAALWLKGLEHGFHNVTLGGVNAQGADAANELTYLMLQTARALHATHPRVSLRVHEHTPEALLDLAVRMWSEGMSDPTLAGDWNVLMGLERLGIPLADARDYTVLGCQEIEIPGRSNFGCEDGTMNLAKLFEYAANDGADRRSGRQVGPRTGKLADFPDVEALWRAFLEQMRFFVPPFVALCNRGVEIRDANLAKLVKMPFTRACVERGRNPDAGGALYNPGVVETAGSAAAADAFAAIEQVVFRERRFSMATLDRALTADFAGYEKERLLLLRAPKFGNDDALADRWAFRVLDAFWDEIARYRSRRGGPFTGACSLLEAGIAFGANTWAMPDGRRAGEPLGNSIGPRTGSDHSGLTAMLNSVAKLPLNKGVGGSTLNVLLPANLMKSEALRADIALVMRTYLRNGGQMAQVTTASREELLDARIHPERHGNLIVRIGGFSIRFVELSAVAQDEVIARFA